MPFLSEADQDQIKTIFSEQMEHRVRLRLLTRPPIKLYVPGQQLCASCGEAEPFVRELATLSDKLEVVVHDVQAEPALADEYDVRGVLRRSWSSRCLLIRQLKLPHLAPCGFSAYQPGTNSRR